MTKEEIKKTKEEKQDIATLLEILRTVIEAGKVEEFKKLLKNIEEETS